VAPQEKYIALAHSDQRHTQLGWQQVLRRWGRSLVLWRWRKSRPCRWLQEWIGRLWAAFWHRFIHECQSGRGQWAGWLWFWLVWNVCSLAHVPRSAGNWFENIGWSFYSQTRRSNVSI